MSEKRTVPRDIITVGASAGGVEALIELLGSLPGDLYATLAIVIHRSPNLETQLPSVLGRRAKLPVLEPRDGTAFERGYVYIAPRDHHLLVENGTVRIDRGPKQHRTRPAIDPLFRSAARAYGPRVVGVLLSGVGADGVDGLVSIKGAGGVSIVQDPSDARHGAMPRNAIAGDDVDFVLPLAAIPKALVTLAAGGTVEITRPSTVR